ncbi:MAG: hypothetical protein IPP18_00185 [Rhodocyclaceae bacterium]|nr:hypothetical protein [Rhodocyclaceae bacterium]
MLPVDKLASFRCSCRHQRNGLRKLDYVTRASLDRADSSGKGNTITLVAGKRRALPAEHRPTVERRQVMDRTVACRQRHDSAT